MSIIAISNQKGGVAKTTTTANLGYILAKQGKRVLLVDLDPQANLTSTSTTEKAQMSITDALNYLIKNDDPPDAAQYIGRAGIADIISSDIGLASVEQAMTGELGAEMMLKLLLDPIKAKYDYILIDTGRSISALLITALAAADGVVVPVAPSFYSTSGLQDLILCVRKLQKRMNPNLKIYGILFTMVQGRDGYRKCMEEICELAAGRWHIFETIIPRATAVEDALWYGSGVVEVNPKNKAAVAYRKFAKELIQHEI